MLHMKLLRFIKNQPIHELLFYVFLIVLPFQTRIIYNPSPAYIDWYFSYPLAYFVYLSDLLLFLTALTWLIFAKKNVSPLFKPIVLLIIWVFLTLFGVKHFSIGLYQAFKWLELLFLLYFISNVARATQRQISLGVIYISGIIQAILGILQFHMQHSMGLELLGEYVPAALADGAATLDIAGSKLLRAYGTFPHPNVFAAYLLVSLIIGFYFVSRETRKKWLILALFGNILLFIGIFLTFSRVVWFTAAVSGIAFVIYYLATKAVKPAILLLISGFVSCATILVVWHNLLFSRASDVVNSRSFIDRGVFNNFGFTIFKQNWLTGTGVGNYIPTMQEMFHLEAWQYQPAHNIFIYIAATLGIVGLFLFLWLLWAVFKPLVTCKPGVLRATFLILGFSLLFISNFDHFLVTIQQGQLIFFTTLGLIASSSHPERSEGSNG